MAGDTVVTKKPRKRISFNKWHSQFMQLAHNDPKSSELLRQWAFYGMLSDMLPFLLYVYVSGAPAATESRAAVKKHCHRQNHLPGRPGYEFRFRSRRKVLLSRARSRCCR